MEDPAKRGQGHVSHRDFFALHNPEMLKRLKAACLRAVISPLKGHNKCQDRLTKYRSSQGTKTQTKQGVTKLTG